MKRILITVLGGLIINLSVVAAVPAQADKDAQRIAKVKRAVNKIGVDENVNVKFLDGTRLKGRITIIGDNSFVVVKKATADSMAIRFDQVKEVRGVTDNPFSEPATLLGLALIPTIIGLCFWARNKD